MPLSALETDISMAVSMVPSMGLTMKGIAARPTTVGSALAMSPSMWPSARDCRRGGVHHAADDDERGPEHRLRNNTKGEGVERHDRTALQLLGLVCWRKARREGGFGFGTTRRRGRRKGQSREDGMRRRGGSQNFENQPPSQTEPTHLGCLNRGTVRMRNGCRVRLSSSREWVKGHAQPRRRRPSCPCRGCPRARRALIG